MEESIGRCMLGYLLPDGLEEKDRVPVPVDGLANKSKRESERSRNAAARGRY